MHELCTTQAKELTHRADALLGDVDGAIEVMEQTQIVLDQQLIDFQDVS